MFMSQQVSDFDSPAAQAIKNNSGNYVFLQQNPEEIGTIIKLFNLTEQEGRLAGQGAPPRHLGRGVPVAARRRGAASSAWCRTRSCAGWRARSRTSGARGEKLRAEMGDDLMGAVSQLARQYPLGLPMRLAG